MVGETTVAAETSCELGFCAGVGDSIAGGLGGGCGGDYGGAIVIVGGGADGRRTGGEGGGCFWATEHTDVEIPQQESAIFANGAETVVSFVAAPGVEGYGCDPALVAGTAGHDAAFGEGPDGNEVVLAACEDVFAVGGETDAGEGAVVGGEEVGEGFRKVVDEA